MTPGEMEQTMGAPAEVPGQRSTSRMLPGNEPYAEEETRRYSGMSHLPKGVKLTPVGDVGEHRGMEAYELGTFKGCKTMTKKMAGWKAMSDHTAREKDYKGKGA